MHHNADATFRGRAAIEGHAPAAEFMAQFDQKQDTSVNSCIALLTWTPIDGRIQRLSDRASA